MEATEIPQLLILANTCLSRNLQTGICLYTMIRNMIDVSVTEGKWKDGQKFFKFN